MVTWCQQTDFCSWAEVSWGLFKTKGEVGVESRPLDSSVAENRLTGQEGLGPHALGKRILGHFISMFPGQKETQIQTPWAQPGAHHAQGKTRVGGLVPGPRPFSPGPADGAPRCRSKAVGNARGFLGNSWGPMGVSPGAARLQDVP